MLNSVGSSVILYTTHAVFSDIDASFKQKKLPGNSWIKIVLEREGFRDKDNFPR
jgi:hypothetical protein